VREWQHDPAEHNGTPVWPRASFGLPIVGQFQRRGRDGSSYDEPPDFQLLWREAEGDVRDRLASPLVVKAMPLANGRFVPVALWLLRSYPQRGQVVLLWQGEAEPVEGSAAPFDRLVADGDRALYMPLQHKTMREAFGTWLRGQGVRRIQ
jgi:CRISPR-associated protein Cmr1